MLRKSRSLDWGGGVVEVAVGVLVVSIGDCLQLQPTPEKSAWLPSERDPFLDVPQPHRC